MEGVLRLLPIGGLGISLLMICLGVVYDFPNQWGKAEQSNRLFLILRDYEEQVEGLFQWLQFRCWWLESPLELFILIEPSQDDTLKLVTRLQRNNYPFRLFIVPLEDITLSRGEETVMKLAGEEPVPWGDLKGLIVRKYGRRVA